MVEFPPKGPFPVIGDPREYIGMATPMYNQFLWWMALLWSLPHLDLVYEAGGESP